ncbi:HAMP domain-containing protein [Paenibacillus sp. BK033]|uniref:sensor histidine kinase n=1 Tax=Paenibacillus sp. BK033 TaxID=2512133 RepID=UPI00104BD00D|nr:sensor histidine kinase [Paenibacillus sp. BK033]TCM88552.1 HAMP domain-containing protein [Paenibacillus sp. BK033]
MRKVSFRLASSFRNRMIFIFLLIIIVPFLLFAYYSHIKSIEGISETNTKMTMSYLLQAKKNFEIYLNNLNEQVNEVIGNKSVQDLLYKEPVNEQDEESFAVNMLTALYHATPVIDAFRVKVYPINPTKYPSYMRSIDESVRIGDQYWFQRSKATVEPTWYLTMPKQGKYAKPLLTYVKRFSGLYDSKVRGLIATDLSDDFLERYFSPSDQLKDQKLLLVNDKGIVHYDSAVNEWTGQPFPSESFVNSMKKSDAGSQSITIGGQTYLATYVAMANHPWTIVSLTPLKELTGAMNEINRVLIIFLIVYLLCCFSVVIYLTVTYTQPIAHLVRLMRKLEADNLHYLSPWSSRKDEVGWLFRSVGSMVHRIDGLVKEAARSERNKKALEFQVLSHQINPHFLYNTLESIRWKAENHGRSDISEMVSALGNLLRLSLNQGKEITTLKREFDQVKAYVAIEQARMGKTVRILYACDEETLELPFLRLLLQPLVENAIQHSVRDNFDKGKIMIAARQEEGDIVMDIADNGKGIPQHVLDQLEQAEEPAGSKFSPSRRGVGLRNVNDRLKLYFGEAYKLKIVTGPDIGTKITLKHPVLKEGQELDSTFE